MTPYDQRLVELMDATLKAYDAGTLDFRAMLDRLESCAENMSKAEAAWREGFRREWGTLEDIYAFAAAGELKTIPESDMPLVESALTALKRMVSERLRS